MTAESIERSKYIPKFGIFGPTRTLNEGINVNELTKKDSNGIELEFCTDEISEQIDNLIVQEDKYFNTPDIMKGSYLLDEYESNESNDLIESLTSFEKLEQRMTNVIADGGVKKIIRKEGVGKVVPTNSKIRAHYNAYLEDMVEPYDSSRLRGKHLEITLGNGNVIPGLDFALASMRKQEVARFLIKPEYAYGKMGCMPRIPPNATLLFEVELFNFFEASLLTEFEESCDDEKKKFSFDKMISIIKAEKLEGNDLYQQELYPKAVTKYMKTVNLLESLHLKNQSEEDIVISLASKLYLNMGLSYIKLGNFKKAISASKRVLEFNPNNGKALYIVGRSLRSIGDFNQSRNYLLQSMAISPKSKDIKNELKLLDEMERNYKMLEKATYQRMFP